MHGGLVYSWFFHFFELKAQEEIDVAKAITDINKNKKVPNGQGKGVGKKKEPIDLIDTPSVEIMYIYHKTYFNQPLLPSCFRKGIWLYHVDMYIYLA